MSSAESKIDQPEKVIDRAEFDAVITAVVAGVSARQVGTGGWRLIGPLAPVTPTSIGRFRSERKALEQQVIHALARLIGWEFKGEEHYRAIKRIQRRLNLIKANLPTTEAFLIKELAAEGFTVAGAEEL